MTAALLGALFSSLLILAEAELVYVVDVAVPLGLVLEVVLRHSPDRMQVKPVLQQALSQHVVSLGQQARCESA
jgi:hypothetical protein